MEKENNSSLEGGDIISKQDRSHGLEYEVSVQDKELASTLFERGNLLKVKNANEQFSPEVKVAVIRSYVETGSLKEACKAVKPELPYRTILRWKIRSPWWGPLVSQVRKEMLSEVSGKFQDILRNAVAEMLTLVKHGKVDKKGNLVPLAPRELTDIVKTAVYAEKLFHEMEKDEGNANKPKPMADMGKLLEAFQGADS